MYTFQTTWNNITLWTLKILNLKETINRKLIFCYIQKQINAQVKFEGFLKSFEEERDIALMIYCKISR